MESTGENGGPFNLRDAVKWALILIILGVIAALAISRLLLIIIVLAGGSQ